MIYPELRGQRPKDGQTNVFHYHPISRGTTLSIPVTVFDESDIAIDVKDYKLAFTVKRCQSDFDVDDSFALIKKEVFPENPTSDGKFIIKLSGKDTDLPPGHYFFDIEIFNPSSYAIMRMIICEFDLIGGPTNRKATEFRPYTQFSTFDNGSAIDIHISEGQPIVVLTPSLSRDILDDLLTEEHAVYMRTLNVTKLDDYIYSASYYSYSYEKALAYFKAAGTSPWGCSSFRNGNFYGRNFDWVYSSLADIVVQTHRTANHYASVGVCSIAGITEDVANSGAYHENYEILPWHTLDGVNEYGVACNINIVEADYDFTTGTLPGEEEFPALMVVRYVLDNAKSARDAIEKIKLLNIVAPHGRINFEPHWMIMDENSTYIVEIKHNKLVILESSDVENVHTMPKHGEKDVLAMTNFFVSNIAYIDPTDYPGDAATEIAKVGFNIGGGIEPTDTRLNPHAIGLERYSIILDNMTSATSVSGTFGVLNKLNYTHTYQIPTDYFSEFVELDPVYGDLTVYQESSHLQPKIQAAITAYSIRERDAVLETWQTVHSTVINLADKKLYVAPQEKNASGQEMYEFEVPITEPLYI